MPRAPSEPAKLASGSAETPSSVKSSVKRDREHGAERGARRDAERVGRGERVAKQRLEDDARQRQAAADERGRQHARQARDEEDLRVNVVGERHRSV